MGVNNTDWSETVDKGYTLVLEFEIRTAEREPYVLLETDAIEARIGEAGKEALIEATENQAETMIEIVHPGQVGVQGAKVKLRIGSEDTELLQVGTQYQCDLILVDTANGDLRYLLMCGGLAVRDTVRASA